MSDVKLDLFHKILFKLSGTKLQSHTFKVDDIVHSKHITNIKTIDIPGSAVHISDNNNEPNCFITTLLNLLKKIPINDIDNEWFTVSDSVRYMSTYFGTRVMNSVNVIKYKYLANKLADMESVKRLKYIATNGMGAHLIKKSLLTKNNKEIYEIDLLYMHNYQVRHGLEKYGAKLVLDKDLNVLYISCYIADTLIDFKPSSENWQFAYNIFTSSLVTHVTIVNHAIECHFILAGGILTAHTENYDTLHNDVYKFFNPFLFKTSEINTSALSILISKGGIVSRLFAFTEDSLEEYMKVHFNDFKYVSPLNSGWIDTPFSRDAIKYWNIYKKFSNNIVDSIFNLKSDIDLQDINLQDINLQHINLKDINTDSIKINNYGINDKVYNIKKFINSVDKYIPGMVNYSDNMTDKDRLIDIMTSHMFNISIWHEHIGNMSWYVLNPKNLRVKNFTSKLKTKMDTCQTTLQGVFLALLTSVISMPKMSDKDLYLTQHIKYRSVWKKFNKDFNNLKIECEHLHQNDIECSVSL